ncbi:MAG TPA: serine/threonine-protein kinase, partial [Polyangiales bacterium]|nr:serine/threonine-protein kinase [Polyangiales bacterium]
MGTVFRACDLEHSGRPVAVKVLPGLAAQPRFEREVAALSSLDSDAIVRYVAHGRSDAGEAFLAMDWVDGQSLAERLAVSGLSGIETVQLGKRLASGLCALHAAGIVHRDLKPSNVMLPDGRVEHARIVDLGIARLGSDLVSVQLTAAGAQLGTPRYMAPEQIRDPHAVDGRADVFALGCVLFEALTGAPAFPGDEAVSVLAQVLFGHTPEAGERRGDLPDELEQLLERLLARSRKLRPFADAQLLLELDRLLEPPLRQELAAVPAMPPRSAAAAVAAFTQTSAGTVAGSYERPSYALLVSRPAREQRQQSRRSWPPVSRGPWVGRDHELSQLCGLLERERCVAVRGGAGVGKTRLAVEAVRVLASVHADWTPLFCELAEARDSADVVRVVSERAGLPLAAHAEPEYVLGGLLAKLGELVLVLDRCEHLCGEL